MSKSINQVVNEILEGMEQKEKNTIRYTKEDDLIQYLHNWGRQIRNRYQLWHDPALVEATGKDHPDDASMVIIKNVWQALQATEPSLNSECPNIRTVYHQADWHIPYAPVCDDCGLPYYAANLSGDWVHPFEINGKWIGLPESDA